MSEPVTNPLPEQEAIMAKCFHPTGTFLKFGIEEIDQSIPSRFEKIVRQFPHRLAVKMGGRALTYEQLNRVANRIAHSIVAKRGAGSEPIAVLFDHGIDAIAGILGVLKAGKFYVAIDRSLPHERIAYFLAHSEAGLVITDDPYVDLAKELTKESLAVLSARRISSSSSSENLDLPTFPDDLANCRYTSGSTGEPKGVIETHRDLLHSVMLHTNDLAICSDDRLSLLHSVSFGAAKMNLYGALLNGASLFPFTITAEGVQQLLRWLGEEQITIFHSSPNLFRQLVDVNSGSEKPPRPRLIRLSGAPITRLDFEIYRKHFSHNALLNLTLSATETNAISSCIVDSMFSFPQEGAPAGYPVTGKKVLILDDNGSEVRPGEVGEIAVKSCHLTAGYWRRPELTASKFFLDVSDKGERMYLTGDLGRMLSDGMLIHLGRKDLMVKIRGYRVELGEVEQALLGHREVKEVGLAMWDRESGEKFLAAYVVTRGNPGPPVGELRAFLREKLPDYMIPSVIMYLESLPLTNGKLDRKALPKPHGERPEVGQCYLPPRSEVEKTLAAIWESILDIRPIGIHDNFFDLGGHSLAAMQVVSRVIKQFKLEIPLQSLFQSPTIAEMANVVAEHQGKTLGEKELDVILTELEAMPDEEARRLFADQREMKGAKEPK